ncbi:MAG: PIN domain-containing protein [Nostoc sp.]|uniref:PIN domain-containing protein n=1 Tax=Nostoc sp. TaxID=1180 RepID=UPI002FF9432C
MSETHSLRPATNRAITFCDKQAAQIKSILKTAGTPIDSYDVLIAATALTHNHIVVTSNVREFQRVLSLQIENWRSY